MSKNHKDFRAALLGSAATFLAATALGYSPPAMAQDAAADDDVIEEIFVTGSRIPRADIVSNSPLTVIGNEEFELSMSVEAEDVLTAFPQILPQTSPSSNNPGTGTALVDLRNMGSVRTLVLVNGRRFIGSDQFGRVDINNIPPALIDRVDVVTGGASAVYGSDAVTGVVNFILKTDFEGLEASSSFGVTQEGDSERWNTSIVWGSNFADGRGNVTLFMNYFFRDQEFGARRPWGAVALNSSLDANGNLVQVPGGSSTIPQLRFGVGSGLVDPNGTPIGGFGILFENNSFRAAVDPDDRYNFSPVNNLVLPLKRWAMAGTAHYEINEYINWFAETNFVNSRINRTLAATPFSGVTLDMDLRNPFMPADFAAFAAANLDTDGDNLINITIARRMLEVGLRVSQDFRNTYRFLTGFDGDFGDGWHWETYLNYGRFERSEEQDGNVAISRMKQGLLVDPANPTQCLDPSNGCVVLNVFGEGVMTEAMADFVRVKATNNTRFTQAVVAANLTGSVLELPAGPLGVAFGLEYRDESSSFSPDTFLASGDVRGFNAGLPTVGGFDVWEIYGEALIPIFEGAPGVEYLGIEGGFRFSEYSSAGSVTSYKILGNYRPVPDLKIRGGFQRAVRAPNISELFRGQSNSFPGGDDFCNADADRTAAERTFCLANGIPVALIDTFKQTNTQIEVLLGGNPDLMEETADTWTIGGVYEPSQVPGLTITADWYQIKIADAIDVFGGGLQTTITACQLALDAQDEFCAALTTARQPDGQMRRVKLFNGNISSLKGSGIDFRVSYQMELPGDWGSLDAFVAGTRMIDNEIQGSPVVPVVECAGFVGVRGTCNTANPKWKTVSRVTWRNGPTTVSLRHRFITGVTDERIALDISNGVPPRTSLPIPKIPARHYFDLTVAWRMNETYRISAAITNLLNQDPPILDRAGGVAGQNNTDSATYDVLGRRFTIGATATF